MGLIDLLNMYLYFMDVLCLQDNVYIQLEVYLCSVLCTYLTVLW